ncbi:MAG: hypothetical protein MZV70_60245 [Desulfobacterales bacterium]|nr:hypothetical protein [Desulfobacterales bacterium]
MIKSVIITHGNLGRELVQVAEKILEQKLDIESIAFDWQGDGSAMISPAGEVHRPQPRAEDRHLHRHVRRLAVEHLHPLRRRPASR